MLLYQPTRSQEWQKTDAPLEHEEGAVKAVSDVANKPLSRHLGG